jgi:myosin-1
MIKKSLNRPREVFMKLSLSDQFNEKIVLHQVKYLGLMENLRVRRAGFAYRRPYEQFLQRYKCLCSETWPNYHGLAKEGVQVLVCHLGYECDEYRMGK